MAKRVFFSFHYDNDITRAQRIRNSWVTHSDRESSGFFDASIREEAKSKGSAVIERLINEGLKNTSVTAVLIGSDTANRRWVKTEISKSIERGNGLLGIRVHKMKDLRGLTASRGPSPFTGWTWNDKPLDLSAVPIYDWVDDDGYNNIGSWVANAYVVPRPR